jgi:HK97 family phage prohead protease
MRTLSLKPDSLHTRQADDGTMTIEGRAVPYREPIDYAGIREEFAPSAFDPEAVVGAPLLWSHNRSEPLGHITDARNTDDGLDITAVIQPTTRGRDAMALLGGGSLRGLSVGFTPDETDQTPHGVTYTRASLLELSLTPLPAYKSATVTATREEESPMSESTETREAPQVDLSPLTERIDQLEARMIAAPAQPVRTLGVVEAFTEQLRDAYNNQGHIRALADVLSSGNAGVLPPTWSSEVRDYVDSVRYLFPHAGSMAFPSTGHTLTVPKVLTSTTVGARGTEKTNPPTSAYTTGSDTFQAQWVAGGVDVAMELIFQSDPAILSLVVQDMLSQYGKYTNVKATQDMEAASAPAGAALDTATYGGLIADLIQNGEAIRAETGVFGNKLSATTASYVAILGLVDSDNRRIFATNGASNADGSARLDAQVINIGGVDVFHNPAATEDVQFNSKAFRIAEKPPMTIQQDNVALLGRDLGVLGAIISLPLYPAGIIGYSAL